MPLVNYSTGDLFASSPAEPGELLHAFARAFASWIANMRSNGQLTRDTSEVTYEELWGVLVKWCLTQVPPVRLEHVDEAALEACIASRHGAASAGDDLSPRYVWRFLSLIDRVLAHLARQQGGAPNPAAANLLASRPKWRFANAASADELPEHLPALRAKQLVAFLSEARPRAGGHHAKLTWHELRNRASVGLQLGAGLTPGDVRAVLTGDVAVEGGRLPGVPWKLAVPGDGSSPARETPIAPWAGQLLRHWMQVRLELGILGPYLFPSTKVGKQWNKVPQYLAAKAVLMAAGFPEELASGGSFRMRHTFALRQLRRGQSASDVARWLGVVDPAVMARYRRVLVAPVDGVE
jgi:integrase